MAKLSAGLLPYRITREDVLELFIVHPGGPFWANKDHHAWSVAKGEHEPLDDPAAAAEREFAEELGVPAPTGTPGRPRFGPSSPAASWSGYGPSKRPGSRSSGS